MAAIKSKPPTPRPPKAKEVLPESKIPALHTGEVLRQAREARGITLDGVANELMIRRFYLEALENGSFKDLPERVYAVGFVKNYGTYLGMDTVALTDQFKREAFGARNVNNYQVDLSMPQPVIQSVVPNRSAIISAIVVLALLVSGIIFMTQGKKSSVSAIPEPAVTQDSAAPEITAPAATATATPAATTAAMPAMEFSTSAAPEAAATVTSATPAETAITPPADTESAATAAQKPVTNDVPPAALRVKNRRVLEALQSAWVEVRNDKGTTLFTSILKAGQILPLPDNTRILLTTGNAGGMRVIVDGKPQAVFGQVNEVKRNIPIENPATAQR